MYVTLGNQWATCLLALLSLLLVGVARFGRRVSDLTGPQIPIPYYLFFHGRKVRFASPYCREHFDEEG
jgi:hypothetical protein